MTATHTPGVPATPRPDGGDSAPPRAIWLRIFAGILAGLWTGLGLAVLITYRPGGPLDVAVGLAAFLPVAVVTVAIVWPPVAHTWRGAAAVIWLAITAALLVIPLIGLVGRQLVLGVGRTLLPSPEVAYGAVLATVATALYATLGLVSVRGARSGEAATDIDRRPGVFAASAAAVAITVAIGVVFGSLAWVNDAALREVPVPPSRFGPTDPVLPLPRCADPLAIGAGAALTLEVEAREDDEPIGTALLTGERAGTDERWTGSADGPLGPVVTGYTRIGGQAWILADGRWAETTIDPFGLAGLADLTVDGPVAVTVRRPDRPPVAEDLGVEIVGGAKARRCRTAIDGPTAHRAFVALRWLAGGDPVAVRAPLTAWRGTLDWWVFADGQLGQAFLSLNGYPGDAWGRRGIQGEIRARLTATDRGAPHAIVAPVSAPGDASAPPAP